jgi:hypothetical protein
MITPVRMLDEPICLPYEACRCNFLYFVECRRSIVHVSRDPFEFSTGARFEGVGDRSKGQKHLFRNMLHLRSLPGYVLRRPVLTVPLNVRGDCGRQSCKVLKRMTG